MSSCCLPLQFHVNNLGQLGETLKGGNDSDRGGVGGWVGWGQSVCLLAGAAGVALEQPHDGRVVLRSLHKLLQRQFA